MKKTKWINTNVKIEDCKNTQNFLEVMWQPDICTFCLCLLIFSFQAKIASTAERRWNARQDGKVTHARRSGTLGNGLLQWWASWSDSDKILCWLFGSQSECFQTWTVIVLLICHYRLTIQVVSLLFPPGRIEKQKKKNSRKDAPMVRKVGCISCFRSVLPVNRCLLVRNCSQEGWIALPTK